MCLFSSKLLTLLQFLSIFPLCVIPLSDYNVLRLIIMHKRLVVNIFSSLLLGAALISAPVYAAEK
ncbi:LacI family transcriptional regulator, partial [Klebsiella pneumoniae]